jgi:peptidylprolyl isomerase
VPPTKRLLAIVLAASLLVACGDDDGAGGGAITVEGDVGAPPSFEIPAGLEVTELVIEDVVVGDGDEVQPGATVTVHYAGVLLDGTEFDSSFSRGQTATFPLDQVIAGWTEGIPGMKVGGRRLLVIPSDLAYGAAGRPGIPPDAPLVFVVDLVDIG